MNDDGGLVMVSSWFTTVEGGKGIIVSFGTITSGDLMDETATGDGPGGFGAGRFFRRV